MAGSKYTPKHIGSSPIHFGAYKGMVGFDLGARLLGGEKLSGKTIANSLTSSALWLVAPPALTTALLVKDLGAAAAGAAYGIHRNAKNKYAQRIQTGPSFAYQDTEQAATMRQAGIQAIQGSKMNARNSLGGEAQMMYRRWSR